MRAFSDTQESWAFSKHQPQRRLTSLLPLFIFLLGLISFGKIALVRDVSSIRWTLLMISCWCIVAHKWLEGLLWWLTNDSLEMIAPLWLLKLIVGYYWWSGLPWGEGRGKTGGGERRLLRRRSALAWWITQGRTPPWWKQGQTLENFGEENTPLPSWGTAPCSY